MIFLIYAVMDFVNMSASVYGWLCMIIVLILLVAASKFLDMDKEFTFFLGAIFFCIRYLSALIMGSISYFFGDFAVTVIIPAIMPIEAKIAVEKPTLL